MNALKNPSVSICCSIQQDIKRFLFVPSRQFYDIQEILLRNVNFVVFGMVHFHLTT